MTARKLHAVVVAVALLLPLALLVQADPAASQVPSWADDFAQEVEEGCAELPETLMGSGTAEVGWAIPAAAPGGATITTAGGSAAAGGVAATGAVAALAAATFVGVGCLTVNFGSWLTKGNQHNGARPDWDVAVERHGLHDCVAPLPVGYQTGDKCMSVSRIGTALPGDAGYMFAVPGVAAPDAANHYGTSTPDSAADPRWLWSYRLGNGQTYGQGGTADVSGRAEAGAAGLPLWTGERVQVAVPCHSPEFNCGLNSTTRRDTHMPQYDDSFAERIPWFRFWRDGCSYGSCTVAMGPVLSDAELDQGKPRRMRSNLTCKRPLDGDIVTVSDTSEWWWDGEAQGPSNWTPQTCPNGYAPIEVDVSRQRAVGGTTSAPEWVDDGDSVIQWEHDDDVIGNPDALQCWVVPFQLSNCPVHDPDPGNPAAPKRLGGPDGVPFPKDAPTTKTDTIDDILDGITWPDTDPRTNPTTTTSLVTTTTTATSTTTTTTIATDDERCPGPGCPTPEPPPDDGSGDSECLPNGWGWFNPIEWVLKPVKCALLWFFWDDHVADQFGELWGETADPWVDAVTGTVGGVEFSSAVGPCLPEMQGAELCTSELLQLELPQLLIVLITGALGMTVVFELVGMFARVTEGV